MGMLFHFKGDHTSSVTWLRKALELFPNDRHIHENLALVYSHLLSESHTDDQFTEGVRTIKRSLTYIPTSANTTLNLAIIYARFGKHDVPSLFLIAR